MYRILPVDGGGLRGLIALRSLCRLEEKYPGFLASIDMCAGTSTGAFIACGLALGIPPGSMIEFYLDNGKAIFTNSLARRLDLTSAKYPNAELRKAVSKIFGEAKVKDLRKKILIAAFRADGYDADGGVRAWGPKFYNSWQDGDTSLVDVCMASSAAPTYFPMYGKMVDGGVVANNPSMCALTEAITRDHQELKDVEMISLGTGSYPHYVPHVNGDMGQLAWMRHGLVDIILDGGVLIPHHQCKALLGARYARVQLCLPENLAPMDKPENMGDLLQIAQSADLSAAFSAAGRWVEAEKLAPLNR